MFEAVPVVRVGSMLRDACGIVEIAQATFGALAHVRAFRGFTLALHAPDGRPVFTVDRLPDRTDAEREAFLGDGWTADALLTALMATHVAQADERALLVPLFEPAGLVGTLRCDLAGPCTASDERHVAAIAMLVAGRLQQLAVTAATLASDNLLTRRQRDTADRALQGMTTDQIAASLAISRNTVKKHLHEVFDRLSVSNRVQLARALQITHATSGVPFGITHTGDVVVARRAIVANAFGGNRRNGARGNSVSVLSGAAG